jgi:hypothetical protein
MNTIIANQNHSELNNGNHDVNTPAIKPSVPDQGNSAGTIRPEEKRRDSFLSALLRSLSAVAF